MEPAALENVIDQHRSVFSAYLDDANKESLDLAQALERDLKIEDQDSLEFAAEVLRDVKRKKKMLEEERTKGTRGLYQTLETIRGWFRGPIRAYEAAEAVIKNKIAAYHREQAAAQRRALEVAGSAALAGDRDGAVTGMQAAHAAQVSPVKGLSTVEVWGDYEVTNAAAVPREFLTINDRAVRTYLQEHKGKAQIPGIRAVKRLSVRARTT